MTLLGAEGVALSAAALLGTVAALGSLAARLSGASIWLHVLMSAVMVLVLGLLAGVLLLLWLALRRRWLARLAWLPAAIAVILAGGAAWLASGPRFSMALLSLRAVVGGRAEAERRAIAHQVFAAYRRADRTALARMFERGRVYESEVRDAAAAFDLDADLLMGVAAAESAFHPRDSPDGGRGLFQITAPPAPAVAAAKARLGDGRINLYDPRHNAFVAAATVRRYLDDMRGDLFLGLLAYNIGPQNGGLRTIMDRYGARDFVTIQPYLQHLPRDYPVRVLSAALAYRAWRTQGHLPPYEAADNAAHIQRLGIPGL